MRRLSAPGEQVTGDVYHGAGGEQLAAVGETPKPGGLIDSDAVVVAGAQVDLSDVHGGTDAQRQALCPGLVVDSADQLGARRDGMACASKDAEVAVALAARFHHATVMADHYLVDQLIEARRRRVHRLRVRLPQLRAALDIRQQQRHRASRQDAHTRSLAHDILGDLRQAGGQSSHARPGRLEEHPPSTDRWPSDRHPAIEDWAAGRRRRRTRFDGVSAGASAAPAVVRPAGTDALPSSIVAASVMAAVVVIWGLGPPVTKLISAPPLVAVSMRFWISVPLVWAMMYATGGRVTKEVLRRTALAGALFGVNLAFVFAALHHSSVAVLAVIQTLQPGVVLLVAGKWLGERATGWHISWTAVGVLGVVVAILGGKPEVRGDALGIVFGVASMLTFTAYYLLNRRARSTTPIRPMEWMAGVTLFAGLFITPIALATSSVDDYRQLAGADWLYLLFVAVIVGIVGHTLMSWAHRFIPAARSSLILLAMNIVAIAAAWPIHDEPVTLLQAAGGVVVLLAVAAVLSRPASVQVVAVRPDGPVDVAVPRR